MTPASLSIVLKPLDWVKPYPRNTKNHPEEQVKRLADAIRASGWDQPIVTDAEGVIIKGHGRRLAAILLGMTEVPVLVRSDLSPAQADAARIADNAVVGLQFDTKTMQEEIQRLMGENPDFNLDAFGLTDKERAMMTEILDAVTAPDTLIEDHLAEGERAKAEEREAAERADAEEVPVAKILGFARMTRSEQRLASQALAVAAEKHGDDPKEAFLGMLRDVVEAAR